MTAELAGRAAIESVWGTVRTLRDQWLLLAFMTGALVWLRDTYEEFRPLPGVVAEQRAELVALAEGIRELGAALQASERRAGRPAMVLGAAGHGVEDGRAGHWTVARLAAARTVRNDCRAVGLNAWVVDQTGRWAVAETALDRMPTLAVATDLAFGVRIGANAAPGRARLMVEAAHDCGGRPVTLSVPPMQFRILPG